MLWPAPAIWAAASSASWDEMDRLIRGAHPADGAALADLDRRTWDPRFYVIPRPAAGAPFFNAGYPPEQFLVAVRADRVIGYIRMVQPVPLPSGDHVRQIQGLVVDLAERGRGTGRALIDAVCEKAWREGARRITLRVLSSNPTAQELYERAGFTVEGVQPEEFFIEGRYVDDILMGRRLP